MVLAVFSFALFSQRELVGACFILNRSPVEYTKSSVCATNKESLYGGDSLVFEIVYPYVCSYHNSKFKPEGTLMFDN